MERTQHAQLSGWGKKKRTTLKYIMMEFQTSEINGRSQKLLVLEHVKEIRSNNIGK